MVEEDENVDDVDGDDDYDDDDEWESGCGICDMKR